MTCDAAALHALMRLAVTAPAAAATAADVAAIVTLLRPYYYHTA